MTLKLKSNCCEATMVTNYGDEGTNYYKCTSCGNPCDPKTEFHRTIMDTPEFEKIVIKSAKKANEEQAKMVETTADRFDKAIQEICEMFRYRIPAEEGKYNNESSRQENVDYVEMIMQKTLPDVREIFTELIKQEKELARTKAVNDDRLRIKKWVHDNYGINGLGIDYVDCEELLKELR